MEPISFITQTPPAHDVYKYPVLIDGRLVGFLPEDIASKVTSYVRTLKVKGEVPITTEIVMIPKKQVSYKLSIC